jgi:hypothetical protein
MQMTRDVNITQLEELFDLNNLARPKSQQALKNNPSMKTNVPSTQKQTKLSLLQRQSFIDFDLSGQKYEESIEDNLRKFCVEFVSHAITDLSQTCCFFVILDNAHFMNLSSWQLFHEITNL